jgi:serine protease
MAAPHVAGVAALMKSAKPGLTHVEFLDHLNAGELTQDLGIQGRDDIFGHGLIDAQKSVLQVQQNLGPKLLSSNNSLFFNVSQSELGFIITASGIESDIELGQVAAQVTNADREDGSVWLSLNKNSGLGSYQAFVDRTDLTLGSYSANIVLSAANESVDDLTITVHLQVGNPELSANAGVQYIVIIDENAEPDADGILPTVMSSSALIANAGEYRYEIHGLRKGDYIISSGSDLDFDNVICDAGESCGQYPTLEQPRAITITEDQPQLEINMSVNYVNASRSSLTEGAGGSARLGLSRVVYGAEVSANSDSEKKISLKPLGKRL